ncbi:hypothetical protein ACFWHX_34265, partial [Streptomyces hirsutus]
ARTPATSTTAGPCLRARVVRTMSRGGGGGRPGSGGSDRGGAAPAAPRGRALGPSAGALLVDAVLTAIGLDTGTGREPTPRHYLVIAPTAAR